MPSSKSSSIRGPDSSTRVAVQALGRREPKRTVAAYARRPMQSYRGRHHLRLCGLTWSPVQPASVSKRARIPTIRISEISQEQHYFSASFSPPDCPGLGTRAGRQTGTSGSRRRAVRARRTRGFRALAAAAGRSPQHSPRPGPSRPIPRRYRHLRPALIPAS
jgi:hypothetical protein